MLAARAMTEAALAIYDMDKTVTRRPTYGPFLWHAMIRLSPWRVLLAPLSLLTTLLYALAQRNVKRGVATLCMGGGNGLALAVERL